MNWSSFFLGASLVAVCVAAWSQIRQWQKHRKELRAKEEHETKLNRSSRFDVDLMHDQIANVFERIEKLENKRSKR